MKEGFPSGDSTTRLQSVYKWLGEKHKPLALAALTALSPMKESFARSPEQLEGADLGTGVTLMFEQALHGLEEWQAVVAVENGDKATFHLPVARMGSDYVYSDIAPVAPKLQGQSSIKGVCAMHLHPFQADSLKQNGILPKEYDYAKALDSGMVPSLPFGLADLDRISDARRMAKNVGATYYSEAVVDPRGIFYMVSAWDDVKKTAQYYGISEEDTKRILGVLDADFAIIESLGKEVWDTLSVDRLIQGWDVFVTALSEEKQREYIRVVERRAERQGINLEEADEETLNGFFIPLQSGYLRQNIALGAIQAEDQEKVLRALFPDEGVRTKAITYLEASRRALIRKIEFAERVKRFEQISITEQPTSDDMRNLSWDYFQSAGRVLGFVPMEQAMKESPCSWGWTEQK